MASDKKFVRFLQERLNDAGFSLDVDGRAGEKTRAAMREFQKAMGLAVTGTATQETVDALRNYEPQRMTMRTEGLGSALPSVSGSLSLRPQMNPPLPRLRPRQPEPEQIAMTGPGGSPAPRYPAQNSITDLLDTGLGNILVPGYARRRQEPLPEVTTANSPLAGVDAYQPDRATMTREQFADRFAAEPAPAPVAQDAEPNFMRSVLDALMGIGSAEAAPAQAAPAPSIMPLPRLRPRDDDGARLRRERANTFNANTLDILRRMRHLRGPR